MEYQAASLYSKETRVACRDVDELRLVTEEYILAHTVNGKFTGDSSYLIKHNELMKYLNEFPNTKSLDKKVEAYA